MPSLAIGVGAFCAGELVQYVNKKDTSTAKSFYEIISEAKDRNSQIAGIIPKIEDVQLVNTIKEINSTAKKIIETIEKKPEKFKKSSNFFNYYLPVTVNILNKYDEIENQSLTTEESKKFMKSAKNMINKINEAFKNQLSSLYQAEMIDTDAEMKVFETMLKADGYNPEDDFKINKGEEN